VSKRKRRAECADAVFDGGAKKRKRQQVAALQRGRAAIGGVDMVAAGPDLPEAIKAGILAIVATSTQAK
jgi:hypothetical protein